MLTDMESEKHTSMYSAVWINDGVVAYYGHGNGSSRGGGYTSDIHCCGFGSGHAVISGDNENGNGHGYGFDTDMCNGGGYGSDNIYGQVFGDPCGFSNNNGIGIGKMYINSR